MPVIRTLCAAVLLALLCLPALGNSVSAAPPQRLGDHVTDEAGVLDSAGRAQIRAALTQLHDRHQIRLWVVYVNDFGGRNRTDWANESVRLNDFGDRDVLFAVAVGERDYVLSAPDLSGFSAREQQHVEQQAESALRNGQWVQAATDTANGIGNALGSSGLNWTALAVGGGVIAVGAGGVTLYTRRRKAARTKAGAAAARAIDPSDTAALRALPVEALDVRAREVLVEMDNAVRTSTGELALAQAEFGDAAVAPFATALRNASAALAQAFTIQQQLDDAIPETETQRRELLVTLISKCGAADKELDARVTEFDAMRDLLINAGTRLDTLTQQTVALRVRAPAAGAVLAQLATQFTPAALAPVSRNVTMANELIGFAEERISAARAAISLPAGRQGAAVGAIRAAEDATTQAATLLDAVEGAEAAIQTAIAGLPAAITDARADLALAASRTGDSAVAQASAATQAALTQAERDAAVNPLGVYTALVTADTTLDQAIAAATERAAEAARAQQLLDQARAVAQAQVSAAADFISTRRGAVGATARTQLAEAQRNLAQVPAAGDPAQAIQFAHTAAALAGNALAAAQADVTQWEHRQSGDSGFGGTAGAVLGGILIDSVLRGGFSGGSHGGRYGGDGGGFGPGSFGGAGSSRRIGGSRF